MEWSTTGIYVAEPADETLAGQIGGERHQWEAIRAAG